jgi:hypothetical protein
LKSTLSFIDLSDLPAGVYLIELKDAKGYREVQKLIKNP